MARADDVPAGDAGKRAAGRAASDLVADGMRLGLGTGSTVAWFLEALAARNLDIAGVPTSAATADRCRQLGIPLLDPADVERLDLCVDGADELTADLTLTKGGGGALLREKVVASMSLRMVVVAAGDKLVDRLGDTFPLPVEVVPFAVAPVKRRLEALGFVVTLRLSDEAGTGGERSPHTPGAYRTDNDNALLDCHWPGGIPDPEALDLTLARIPGVAEHGLFVGIASEALLGDDDGSVVVVAPRP